LCCKQLPETFGIVTFFFEPGEAEEITSTNPVPEQKTGCYSEMMTVVREAVTEQVYRQLFRKTQQQASSYFSRMTEQNGATAKNIASVEKKVKSVKCRAKITGWPADRNTEFKGFSL